MSHEAHDPLHRAMWAKKHGLSEPYPLLAHMLDAASAASQLHDHWLRGGLQDLLHRRLGSKSRQILMWLVATHDLGKANPVFQGQLASTRPRSDEEKAEWAEVRAAIESQSGCGFKLPDTLARYAKQHGSLRRHEQVSAAFLLEGEDFRSDILDCWKAIPSMGHHGRFTVPFVDANMAKQTKRTWNDYLESAGWKRAQDELNECILNACDLEAEDLPETVPPEVMILISGLTVLADRLVSSLKWVERCQREMNSVLDLNNLRAWISHQEQQALVEIDALIGIYRGWENEQRAREDILGRHVPRPAQREALNQPNGFLTIMAATGSGKTEAALLRHSLEQERLIFLLPTMATSNALMNRVCLAFRNTANTGALAHSMATIEDFYSEPVTTFDGNTPEQDTGGLVPAEFVRGGLERLLASVVVGTVDQALKSALPVKWVHLVLLALANAHVVIDEVHTLDAYQAHLFKVLLRWLGTMNARVTLLSATLSQDQTEDFFAAYKGLVDARTLEATFPSLLADSGDGIALTMEPYLVRFPLKTVDSHTSVETHVSWVHEQRKKYPQARLGVICNQIGRAQEVARQLQIAGENVILLHSAMTAAHRKKNADLLLELLGPSGEGRGVTVVGTQVIEASLDIDLDLLSTDICPSASLIQRSGRVWRRQDDSRLARIPGIHQAVVQVVTFRSFDKGQFHPYLEALLQRTEAYLRKLNEELEFPQDCQAFVDECSIGLEDITNEEDSEYVANSARKAMAAQGRQSALQKILAGDSILNDLSSLTSSDLSMDEIATRLIEEPTVRAIVVRPMNWKGVEIPGAVAEDVLLNLQNREVSQEDIRSVLEGSINIRNSLLQQADIAMDLKFDRTILKQFVFVKLDQLYDPFLGLRRE